MKTVVVTGASKGIGRAVAKEFANNGYNIVICYNHSISAAQELLAEISGITRAIAIRVDVSKEDEVKNMIDITKNTFGTIDVLVNCAGVSDTRLLIDSTKEDYDFVFDTNMRGTYNTCKLVGREMLSNQSGKIINISSIWGVLGGSCESVYSASKGAIIAFT